MFVKFYFLIICFTLSSVANSQIIIQGNLFLEQSTPAIGGFVTLVDGSDSLSMLDFVTTNDDGSWRIISNLTQKVLLKTSYVGYSTYSQMLDLRLSDSFFIEIRLEAKAAVIENVEVVAKAIDIVQKGDTIQYNIQNFLTGSEQTLGDVLQQLPGFEVDGNGTISYNGQKIDKLLVEGKDILNNQHNLASDGISAEDLLKIEIINQFTDAKDQFSNASSDKIALNIGLNKEDKTSWNTNIELGAGYDSKYKMAVNSIGINEKLGVSLFAKANNTGESVLTINDYFNLQTERNLLNSMNKMVNGIDGILPKSFGIPADLQYNQDELIAANFSYSPTNKLQLKTSFLGVDFNRQASNNFIRTYIGNEQFFLGNSQTVSHLPLLEFQSNFQYQLGERFFFELDIPFAWQRETIKETKKGFFNQNLLQINNKNRTANSRTFPQLYANFKLNEQTHFIGKYAFRYENNEDLLQIQGQDTLFNTKHFAVSQQQIRQTNANIIELFFRREIKKFRIAVKYNFSTTTQQFRAITSPLLTDYQSEITLKTNIHNTSPYIQYNTKNWFIRTGLSIKQFYFLWNDSLNYQAFRVNPSLTVRYNFSKLQFIVFSINRTNNEQPLNNLIPTYQIQNPQTIYQGILAPNEMPSANSYNLTFVNFNIATQTHYSFSANYTTTTNVVSTETFRQPNFIILQPIIQPYQNSFNGRILFNKKIFNKKFSFKTLFNTQFLNGTVIQQNRVNEWNYQSQSLNLEIAKKKNKIFNYSIGIIFNQQQQVFSTLEVESYFRSIEPLGTIDFHKNSWTVKSDLGYLFGLNNTETNELLNWNIKIIYQPKNKPYTFSLIGNNLLNLHGQTQIQSNFNSVFVDIEQFNRFPGCMLLMFKYRF